MKKTLLFLFTLLFAASAMAHTGSGTTVNTNQEFFDALNDDGITEIYIASTGNYQFYNVGGEGLFTRTTDVTLFAEDIATTSIRVSWGANNLTHVNGDEESYKTALARGAVVRAEETKDVFNDKLGTDDGEAELTWDDLIRAMFFYKEQAIPLTAGLAAGTYKTEFEYRIDVLTTYYEGITALNMNDKSTSVFTISSGALETFTGLEELRISNTTISDLGGLVGLTNIKILEANDNDIVDLGALIDMVDLEELYVANNNLTQLNVLFVDPDKKKTSLNKLDASNNAIDNIIALAQLVQEVAFDANNAEWDVRGNLLPHPDNLEHIAIILNKFDAATDAVFLADMTPIFNDDTGVFYGNIQAAIDAADPGETIFIPSGTYPGFISPGDLIYELGSSPGCGTFTSTVTFGAGDIINVDIEGTTECTEHDKWTVQGDLEPNGATLNFNTTAYTKNGGDEFVIFDVTGAINGTFSNPASLQTEACWFRLFQDHADFPDQIVLQTQYTFTVTKDGAPIDVCPVAKVCASSGTYVAGIDNTVAQYDYVVFRTRVVNGDIEYRLEGRNSSALGGTQITIGNISQPGIYKLFAYEPDEFLTLSPVQYRPLDAYSPGYEPFRQNGEFWIIDDATNIQATGDDVCEPFTTTLFGSHDPTIHNAQTYQWSMQSGPTGTASATFAAGSSITTTVTVNEPGEYTFRLTVRSPENSDGSACGEPSAEVDVEFFDIPDITKAEGDDVCDLETELRGEYSAVYDQATVAWSYVSGPDNSPVFGSPTAGTTTVTVTQYGLYTFQFAVTNGECAVVTDTFDVEFFDIPQNLTAEGDDVCDLETSLEGDYDSVDHGTPTYEWTVIDGPAGFDTPGNVTFTASTSKNTDVEVFAYGKYTFQFGVTNGECSEETETVEVEFFDIPTNVSASGPDVCGFEASLSGDYTLIYDQATFLWTSHASNPGNATFTLATDQNPSVEVSDYGTYTFTFAVTNGECSAVSADVVVEFFEIPDLTCPADIAVCVTDGVINLPTGSFFLLSAPSVTPVEEYFNEFVGGTAVTPTFNATAAGVGQHVIYYVVTSVPCVQTCTFTVHVYPEPTPSVEEWADRVYSGSTTEYSVDPVQSGIQGLFAEGAWEYDGNVTFVNNDITFAPGTLTPTASITAFCGGTVSFDWAWDDFVPGGVFFAAYVDNVLIGGYPVDTETGTFEYTLAAGETISFEGYTTGATPVFNISNFAFDIAETYVWTITNVVPAYTGYTTADDPVFVDGINDRDEIQVEAPWPFVGTFDLQVDVSNCAGCGTVTSTTITVLPNTIAGQVKYYNVGETPMPSPFTANVAGDNVYDYFYVMLVESGFDGIDFYTNTPTNLDDIGTFTGVVAVTKVDDIYWESEDGSQADYVQAAFEFVDDINLNPAVEYAVLVWDGGLYVSQPNAAERVIGRAWTWENYPAGFGGVTAVDALLIQHMAVKRDIHTDFSMTHIGAGSSPTPNFPTDYGLFAIDVADVNASGGSNPITALDALITARRAIKLIAQFPGNKPNFAVAGYLTEGALFPANERPGTIFGTTLPNINFFSVAQTPTVDSDYIWESPAIEHAYAALIGDNLMGEYYLRIFYNAVGDINSSHVPQVGFKDHPLYELVVEGQKAVSVGDEVEITISLDDYLELGAFGIGLNYRNDLIEVLATSMDEFAANIKHDEGTVNIIWADYIGKYFTPQNALVSLTVKVLSHIEAGTPLFELTGFTEMVDTKAHIIEDISLKTYGLNTEGIVGIGDLDTSGFGVTNFPNPFREQTHIQYTLPEAGHVKLTVFNQTGQTMKTLVDEFQTEGLYEVVLHNYDLHNPGVYFYRIEVQGDSNDYSSTKSIILIK